MSSIPITDLSFWEYSRNSVVRTANITLRIELIAIHCCCLFMMTMPGFPIETCFFTARNEVRARLCFLRHLWFCPQWGGVPDQVHPPRPGTPQTRYTPQPGTPPGPGTPPRTRFTPPGPGTPPGTRYPPGPGTPPRGPGTPPGTRYTTPPPGTRQIRSTRRRYASYWNAFLFKKQILKQLFQINDIWVYRKTCSRSTHCITHQFFTN